MLPDARPRRGALPDAPAWSGRVVVASPHLDDAALSLGASIRAATRRGARVEVLTVLAGDPASATPADDSNRRAGFATAGEAARARREEDRRACLAVGAAPVWLTLNDDRNDPEPTDGEIRDAVRGALAGADAVLLPAFPLAHPHHRRVAALALDVVAPGTPLGLYVEQPYASWQALARRRRGWSRPRVAPELGLEVPASAAWRREPCRPGDWLAKWRGM